MWCLYQKGKNRRIKQNRESRKIPTHIWSIVFARYKSKFDRERTVSSTKGAGRTRYSYAKNQL